MKVELHDYDIFPMVFLAGREQLITIKTKNRRYLPSGKNTYQVKLRNVTIAEESRFAGSGGTTEFTLESNEDGTLTFTHNFPLEGEYYVQIHRDGEEKHFVRLHLYALDSDMAGRYPYRGDLHMHTNFSDGHDNPTTVAANYRSRGYDFTIISDHRRYYPSINVRKDFNIDSNDNSDLIDMLLVLGEEIHLPLNNVHYVNFGGSYSVNALITPNKNLEVVGYETSMRCSDGVCPPTMTEEEFLAMIVERAKNVDRELESERLSYAVLEWTFEHMNKNGGLGIFPHPYWRCSTMQLTEDYTRYIYKKQPFHAFEVLGGESLYHHNGYQTALYYEMKAQGYNPPIVGSTDSHGSTENFRNADICSTIVFAPQNKTKDLIQSIKDRYSVALDTISKEYHLVGDFRFVKFGCFLMDNWFPLHDAACLAEGFYMKEYAYGSSTAESVLKAMKGQVPSMMNKYFNL